MTRALPVPAMLEKMTLIQRGEISPTSVTASAESANQDVIGNGETLYDVPKQMPHAHAFEREGHVKGLRLRLEERLISVVYPNTPACGSVKEGVSGKPRRDERHGEPSSRRSASIAPMGVPVPALVSRYGAAA